MVEGLNHWPFIAAAYAVTVVATGSLAAWSWLTMRAAEARRERSRDR